MQQNSVKIVKGETRLGGESDPQGFVELKLKYDYTTK